MNEIKPGSRLKFEDGSEVVVETFWNQGKHRVFKLTDGRHLFDLHLNEKIAIVTPEKKNYKTTYKAEFKEEKYDGSDLQDSQG